MPIYEYRCGACGFQKEYLQRMSDAPLTDCPKCGKRTFDKMVTAAGFHLKGTGWYATDFKNKGAKPPAKQEKPAESSKSAENSGKESSKDDATCGAGACPASS
ncbi:MAG: zinc ribbon domain-containing protein [Betaproteobacteria bacterium]|nr:zinc ribbon domain-containing protein [Betaproteobacteria bacterium]